ncbi:MAG: SRPBCC family protein [Candidatus Didemnitutus sp.]|nr:SRPBCC family protein [Candidatus Didemnitutus sp.]
MPIHPFTLTIAASPAAVFHHLADIEQVPRWAPEFCESLMLARGRWLGFTSLGDLYLELAADARTGVIDLRAGDEREPACRWLFRVGAGAEGGTEVDGEFHGPTGGGGVDSAPQVDALRRALEDLACAMPIATDGAAPPVAARLAACPAA